MSLRVLVVEGGQESDDTLGWSVEGNFYGPQLAVDILSSSILPSSPCIPRVTQRSPQPSEVAEDRKT